jgi:16S rRNA (adenine1518-N6/adenine1519-N6)-dimethyltransferase
MAFPRARKRLGQHFLTDTRILDRIVDALYPAAGELVIEIGAGRGALTERLLARGARVVAIELDRDLAAILRKRYAGERCVEIVEGDVLDMSLAALAHREPFTVVGNVPYYITTPIVFHILEQMVATRAVLLVQREVAERMGAAPGSAAFGALSVNVQVSADVKVLFRVAAGAFTPAPKVESALVRLTPRDSSVIGLEERHGFRVFVQALFAQRRKQLRGAIRSIMGVSPQAAAELLVSCGVEPSARAETQNVEMFVRLFRATAQLK